MLLQILVAVFIAVSVAYTFFINYRPGVLPGPFHLPILGATLQLCLLGLKYPTYQLLTELAKKYGNVYRLQWGNAPIVVLTDLELMKEVLASEEWESRPKNRVILGRSFGKDLGLILGNGEKWKEARRFTIKNLKKLGFGRTNTMEDIIRNEVDVLIADIDAQNQQNGKPVDIQVKGFFDSCTFNGIWFMLVGKKMERNDLKMKYLLELSEEILSKFSLISISSLSLVFPFLRKFLPVPYNVGIVHHKFYKVIADMIAEMRKEGSYLNEQNHFFDLYLKEIDRRKEVGAPPGCFFDEEFIITVMDLVMAGYETAAKATEGGILSLTLHPRVQKRIQAEVDAVVGSSRQPCFGDMKNMPYTNAAVLEILRIIPVFPQNIRFAHKETTFGKYTFPAKSLGFFNIYGCHMNPKIWENPREFRPERFLDENMKIVDAHKILSFGHGKRACPGETVARAEIFTYIAALMQRYTIKESVEKPAGGVWLQYHHGFTLSLPPFHAKFVPRESSESTVFH